MIKKTINLYWNLLQYVKIETKKKVYLFLGLSMFAAILDLLNFALLADGLSIILSDGDVNLNFNKIIVLLNPELTLDNSYSYYLITFFITIVLRFIIAIIVLKINSTVPNEINRDLVNTLFDKYIFLPYGEFFKSNTSIYFTRLTSDINSVTSGIGGIFQLLIEIFTTLSIITYFLIDSFNPTILTLIIFIILFVIYFYFISPILKNLSEKKVFFEQSKFKVIEEGLKGFVEITVFKSQNFFKSILARHTFDLSVVGARQYYIVSIPRIVIENIFFLILLIYILLLSIDYLDDSLLVYGSIIIVALLRLTPAAYRIIVLLGGSLNPYQSANLVYKQLSYKDRNKLNSARKKSIKKIHSIGLDNLSFSFINEKEEETEIFNGLDLKFKNSGFLGITGESGSGKSTLIELLLGFEKPGIYSGEILINNLKLNQISLESWHEKIAYIPQNPSFFETTVLENIILKEGSINNYNEKLIKEVLKSVRLDKFINELEDGYFHKLDQNARNISGGQRQRIALARALYNEPSILILDESTNALDAETEMNVLEDLKKISKNIIVIIIAHNKEMYKYCDKIIEL